MPISKKSNIRSRWYRPNEKPLESGTTPQLNEPKGEILISYNEKLIDDLSSAKPNPPKNTDKKRNSNHRNKNRDNNSPEERKPRDNILAEKRIAPKGSIPGQRIIAKGTHKIEIQETTLRIVKTHRVRKLLHHKSKKQEEPKINP